MGYPRPYETAAGAKRFIDRMTVDGVDYSATATTAKEATSRMWAKIKDAKDAPPIPKTKTLATFMEAWLAQKEPDWKPSTRKHNRDHCQRLIMEPLGRYTFPELTLAVVQAWANSLDSPDQKDRCLKLLNTCWNSATDKAVLDMNPCRHVKLPKVVRAKKMWWNDAQRQTFLAHPMEPHYRMYFTLALAWPTRPGEILGLRWRHVDLATGDTRIEASRSSFGNVVTDGPPKTEESKRPAFFGPDELTALRAWKAVQDEHRIYKGRAWQGEDYICTNADGAPLRERSLLRMFHTLAARAGLPDMKLYNLRHTVITSMGRRGMPIELVAAAAGHASTRTTLQSYRGIDPEEVRAAAQAWRTSQTTGA